MSIIADLKSRHRDIKILVATIHESREYACSVFNAGADGYFIKDEDIGALRAAVTCVMNGERYVSPKLEREEKIAC